MKPAAIVFDFDGVIVDSVHVKTEAFRALFMDEEKRLPAILDLHRANGGMSRFIKFEIIYRDILQRPLTAKRSRELGEKFSQLVKQKVVECPFLPGALEFIRKYSEHVPLFIASGTPQSELIEIILKRGLKNYFSETHGSPREKAEIIRDILARHELEKSMTPFIGDAINDYNAASEVGLPFYGFVPALENNPFPSAVNIIRDFGEFENILA